MSGVPIEVGRTHRDGFNPSPRKEVRKVESIPAPVTESAGSVRDLLSNFNGGKNNGSAAEAVARARAVAARATSATASPSKISSAVPSADVLASNIATSAVEAALATFEGAANPPAASADEDAAAHEKMMASLAREVAREAAAEAMAATTDSEAAREKMMASLAREVAREAAAEAMAATPAPAVPPPPAVDVVPSGSQPFDGLMSFEPTPIRSPPPSTPKETPGEACQVLGQKLATAMAKCIAGAGG